MISSFIRSCSAALAIISLLSTPALTQGGGGQSSQAGTPRPADLRTVVAGIPVNYDESKVGNYTLPELLVTSQGERVGDSATWTRVRRPEILRMIETTQFGRAPASRPRVVADRFDTGTVALGGKAMRRQTTLYFTDDRNGPKAEVLSYVPVGTKDPVPLLLQISFSANSNVVDDPGIRPGMVWNREKRRVPAPAAGAFGRVDVLPFIESGIGFATVYYGDIEPDFIGGVPFGIRGRYLDGGRTQVAPDEWGAIAAWAWGLSRVMDYLESEPSVDAKRVALLGASRLGKTVLWTGAKDQRFSMILASVSGEGGAALSRRNYGETIKHITDSTRYEYQFAKNYQRYGDRVDQLPFDAHMLISLIAPRPLLLQTGSTDYWSDPKGEYLAAEAASPVWKLFGKDGLASDRYPAPGELIPSTLGYYMHDGPHGIMRQDWGIFLQFMQRHLPRP